MAEGGNNECSFTYEDVMELDKWFREDFEKYNSFFTNRRKLHNGKPSQCVHTENYLNNLHRLVDILENIEPYVENHIVHIVPETRVNPGRRINRNQLLPQKRDSALGDSTTSKELQQTSTGSIVLADEKCKEVSSTSRVHSGIDRTLSHPVQESGTSQPEFHGNDDNIGRSEKKGTGNLPETTNSVREANGSNSINTNCSDDEFKYIDIHTQSQTIPKTVLSEAKPNDADEENRELSRKDTKYKKHSGD